MQTRHYAIPVLCGPARSSWPGRSSLAELGSSTVHRRRRRRRFIICSFVRKCLAEPDRNIQVEDGVAGKTEPARHSHPIAQVCSQRIFSLSPNRRSKHTHTHTHKLSSRIKDKGFALLHLVSSATQVLERSKLQVEANCA